MLLLTFHAGEQRYAIDAKSVKEIIPMVRIMKLPGVPDTVYGVFNYRGSLVPVIDVTRMISGVPTKERLSSRIILVDYPLADGSGHVLGLLAEHATGTALRDGCSFKDPGVAATEAPWAGKISVGEKDLVQAIDLGNLLTDELKARLFTGLKENAR